MKVGTVPKITAGAVAIIILAYIGTRQFISSKEDASPSVEIVTSTESAQPAIQTDAIRSSAVTAPPREDKPKIAAEEMQQIEDFFAQLDDADAITEMDSSQSSTDREVVQNAVEKITIDIDALAEGTEKSAEDVMNVFVEAFKNLNFDAMGSLMTGISKDRFEQAEAMGFPLMGPEVPEDMPVEMHQLTEQMWLAYLSQLGVINSKYVGEEFHFELGGTPPEMPETPGLEMRVVSAPNELYKMRKENGAWRIYDHETLK